MANCHPNPPKWQTAIVTLLEKEQPISKAAFRAYYKLLHGSTPSARAIDTALAAFAEAVAAHNQKYPPVKQARAQSIAAMLDEQFSDRLPAYAEAAAFYRAKQGKTIAIASWRKWKVAQAEKLGVKAERSDYFIKSVVKEKLSELFPAKSGAVIPTYSIAKRLYFQSVQKTLNAAIFAQWQQEEATARNAKVLPRNAASKHMNQKLIQCVEKLLAGNQPIQRKQLAAAYTLSEGSRPERYNVEQVLRLFAQDITLHNERIGVPNAAPIRPRARIVEQLLAESSSAPLTYEQCAAFYKKTRGKMLPSKAWEEYQAAWK